MSISRKHIPALAGLLLALLALAAAAVLQAGATAADDQEKELLGTLSASYEASSPGTISSGSGDNGGKSYGSYQFASAYDIPKKFFEWCQASDDAYYQSIGNRLSEAYYTGSPGYGSVFDSAWKALASENRAGFEQAQRNYVSLKYYEPIIQRAEKSYPGFDIDNYSIALRNVLWSRAVQHGTGGAEELLDEAFTALGGFANQPESELITAIYEASGAVRTYNANRADGKKEYYMSGTSAEKYGVAGKTLDWFWGSSGDVQLGVYTRLRVNEPAKAQNMLAVYGYVDAPLEEGLYRISPSDNTTLAAVAGSGSLTLNTASEQDSQRFRLTYYASGYYTITNEANGLRLTAKADGTLTMAAATADNNQMWKLTSLNSGFSLCNRATGQYIAASASAGSRISMSDKAMQWQLVKAGAAWSLEGASYPTYANILQNGSSSFPFLGTLRCTYPIQSVKVSVLTASGANAFTPATASSINARSYDLSRLDSKVAFSRLGAGSYKLVIEATSSVAGSGTFRLESGFYVSDGTYLLSFDACGGTVSESSRRVAAGQAYGDLPVATKSGYLFLGWFTAAEGGKQVDAASIATNDNVTIYAHYQKAYTYTFRNYDGSNWTSGQLAEGEQIPKPAKNPTRPADGQNYYTFSGWEGYTEGMTISADVAFTAQYEVHELELLPEITTDAFVIRGGYLRTIPSGTTVAALLKELVPSEYITIHKGAAVSTELVGTGMTVEYTANGETIQTLTVVVTGDTNGDGKITITDMVQLQSHLLGKKSLSAAAQQAADLNGDGKVTITDMVQITSVLLGRSTVKPN